MQRWSPSNCVEGQVADVSEQRNTLAELIGLDLAEHFTKVSLRSAQRQDRLGARRPSPEGASVPVGVRATTTTSSGPDPSKVTRINRHSASILLQASSLPSSTSRHLCPPPTPREAEFCERAQPATAVWTVRPSQT